MTISATAFSLLLAASVQGAPVPVSLPGATQFDGWANLSSATYPGYGAFPGSAPWPTPIASNQSGSGDGAFRKVSGNGFLTSSTVYVGGFSGAPNSLGGTFAVADTTPVANLSTVVFQIEIGGAYGYDLYNHASPTLSYNGGAQALTTGATLLSYWPNGTFTDPVSGLEEPIYVNTWLFQWDLRGLGSISSFDIQWSAVQHAQIFAMQVDQSDTYAAVPTPGVLGVMGAGGVLAARRRRR